MNSIIASLIALSLLLVSCNCQQGKRDFDPNDINLLLHMILFESYRVADTLVICPASQTIFPKLAHIIEESGAKIPKVVFSDPRWCLNRPRSNYLMHLSTSEVLKRQYGVHRNLHILAVNSSSEMGELLVKERKSLLHQQSANDIVIFMLPSDTPLNQAVIYSYLELTGKSKKTMVAIVGNDFRSLKNLFGVALCPEQDNRNFLEMFESSVSKWILQDFLNEEHRCRYFIFPDRQKIKHVNLPAYDYRSFEDNLFRALSDKFNLMPMKKIKTPPAIRFVMRDSLQQKSTFISMHQSTYITFFSVIKPSMKSHSRFSTIFIPFGSTTWIGCLISLLLHLVFYCAVGVILGKYLKKGPFDYAGRKMLELLTVIRFPYRKDAWSGKIGSLVGKTMFAIVTVAYLGFLPLILNYDSIANKLFPNQRLHPSSFYQLFQWEKNGHIYSGSQGTLMNLKYVAGMQYPQFNISIKWNNKENHYGPPCIDDINKLKTNPAIKSVNCVVMNTELSSVTRELKYRLPYGLEIHPTFSKIGKMDIFLEYQSDCIFCEAMTNAVERWGEAGILSSSKLRPLDRKPEYYNYSALGPRPLSLRQYYWYYIVFCIGMTISVGSWIIETVLGFIFRRKIQLRLLKYHEITVGKLATLVAVGVAGLVLSSELECRESFNGYLRKNCKDYRRLMRWSSSLCLNLAIWSFCVFTGTRRLVYTRKALSPALQKIIFVLRMLTNLSWYWVILLWLTCAILPFHFYLTAFSETLNFLLVRNLGAYAAVLIFATIDNC